MRINSSILIYVACPYSHPDKTIVIKRMEIVTKYLAMLSAERKFAFSPLLMHYCLDTGVELPSDYKFWCNHSLTLLSRSNELHILTLPGWDTSEGVLDEIKFANENSIPVEYINSLNDSVIKYETI